MLLLAFSYLFLPFLRKGPKRSKKANNRVADRRQAPLSLDAFALAKDRTIPSTGLLSILQPKVHGRSFLVLVAFSCLLCLVANLRFARAAFLSESSIRQQKTIGSEATLPSIDAHKALPLGTPSLRCH